MAFLKKTAVALTAMATLGATAARAELILVGPVTLGGTGLGAVNTILTLQNNPTEAGCVAFAGASGDQIGTSQLGGVCTGPGGDVKTGNSQTQTRTLSEAGITSGANFAVFFNPVEPAGNSITLNSLSVSFYNNAGVLLHTAVFTGAPVNFLTTDTGTGKTGQMFQLNATEIGVVQTFINSLGLAGIHVGLATSLGAPLSSEGGPETFFIFNSATTPSTVPEPSTTVLLATGLLGIVGFVRRRQKQL